MVACLEKEAGTAQRRTAHRAAGNRSISDYLPGGLRSTKIFKDADDENDVKPSGFYDEDELENFPTARYRYDGQMTLEEDTTDDLQDGTFIDETRYTLGARGIEDIEAERLEGQDSEGVVVGTKYRSFPVYDGHGNMIATLHREASDTYSIKNEKRYNAWGAVRSYTNGGANLNPNKAYVANLGHTLDWETGLIYMRARYYEPSTGRFISEDPKCHGKNWFAYASNNPIQGVDVSGEMTEAEFNAACNMALFVGLGLVALTSLGSGMLRSPGGFKIGLAGVLFLAAFFGGNIDSALPNNGMGVAAGTLIAAAIRQVLQLC